MWTEYAMREQTKREKDLDPVIEAYRNSEIPPTAVGGSFKCNLTDI
jgi:hypothetical protein